VPGRHFTSFPFQEPSLPSLASVEIHLCLSGLICGYVFSFSLRLKRSDSTSQLPKIEIPRTIRNMFSHVVIFWTKPENPKAADELVAGMNRYLRPIPGVLQFHVGKMVPSERPVVDQSYQVALNILFADKATQDAYQVHPQHVEFVEKVFKPNCARVIVYDFEG
jgi:Stress responsive A/B Barrel Domain